MDSIGVGNDKNADGSLSAVVAKVMNIGRVGQPASRLGGRRAGSVQPLMERLRAVSRASETLPKLVRKEVDRRPMQFTKVHSVYLTPIVW